MKLDFRGAIPACMVLLIGLSHVQGRAQVVPSPEFLTMYRATTCTYLRQISLSHPAQFDRSDAPKLTGIANVDRKHDLFVAEWESQTFPQRAAFFQALRECDTRQPAAQPAVNAPRATPEQARAEPVVAGLLPQIGARVDTVSPGFAQSLGLRQASGALVIEAEAGGPAQKAGLQALDVITEITGQQVQSPADLQESLARMRSGFKAQLRVWRNKAMRDIVVTIADMPVAPAVAAPSPSLPSAAAFPQPVPQATPSAVQPPAGPLRFCYAFMVQIGKPGGVQSSLWEERGPDFGHSAMLRSMAGFAVHMRQIQPGIWHDDFPAGKCFPGSNQCAASSSRVFGTSQQISQFCHETREQAEGARKRQGIGLPVIEWTPPAAP